MPIYKDRPSTAPYQIGSTRPVRLPYPGTHNAHVYIVTERVILSDYTRGTTASDTFYNPGTGSTETAYLVDETIASNQSGILTIEKVYAPEFSAITTYGSIDFLRLDWNGLNSSGEYGVSFDSKKQYIYPDRLAISAVGAAATQTIGGSSIGTVEVGGTLVYTSVTGAYDCTIDLTQTAAQIAADLNTAGFTQSQDVIKSGTSITLTATISGASISDHHKSSYVSGLGDQEGYTITFNTDGTMTIAFFETAATVQGTFIYTSVTGAHDCTIDLTQTAAQIATDLNTAGFTQSQNVIKSGNKITLSATISGASIVAHHESSYTSGVASGINYTIDLNNTTGEITIEFFDTNASSSTIEATTAVRALTVSTHGLSQGDDVAVFNGDTLIAATYAVSIDGDDVYIPVGFLSGKNNTATHIGKNSTREEYNIGSCRTPVKITYAFYIPGVTSGIATPANITATQGDDNPQAHLDAVVAADTYIMAQGSDLQQLYDNLWSKEIIEVKTTDVY